MKRNIKAEIDNEVGVFFTVTGKEKHLSELKIRLLDLFRRWGLEVVGSDTDLVESDYEINISIYEQNLAKQVIRERINEETNSDR